MEKEYLTEEDAAKIKKELLKVLRSHDLNSGLAKAVLTDTIETIENYSQLPEQLFEAFDNSLSRIFQELSSLISIRTTYP